MQTFVYSATLSKDLQQNLKRRHFVGGKGKRREKPSSTLGELFSFRFAVLGEGGRLMCKGVVDDLLLRLDFRDPEPEVIDLSPEGGVVSTLQEAKIECTTNDKVMQGHPPDLGVFPLTDATIPLCRRISTYTTSSCATQAAA